jgi:DNA-binding transcriptional regulator YdaS (Cro superfamily)
MQESQFPRAIEAVGSQAELARRLGVFTQHVHNWTKRGLPADRCEAVEAATGIPCELLRPDLDWTRDESGRPYSRPRAA